MEKKPNWILDEIVTAGRENLDPDHILRYDKKEDAKAENEIALLKKFGLNDNSEIIDFGAGTGQFSISVATECAQIYAVDVSELMLEQLKVKIEKSRLSNIQMIQSGFLTYEHQGTPVDFVYSRLALHHLPDFWKVMALNRIRRTIKKGGIFRLWDVIYDFHPDDTSERIENLCNTLGNDIDQEWIRGELEEHIRDEHSTFRWIMESMLKRSHFKMEDIDYSEDGLFGKYILRAI